MSRMKELLFQVFAGGREYRIYTNGRVEGFGDDVKIVNNYPRLRFGRPQAEPAQKDLAEGTVCHRSG
jgi:hypothetical protein